MCTFAILQHLYEFIPLEEYILVSEDVGVVEVLQELALDNEEDTSWMSEFCFC